MKSKAWLDIMLKTLIIATMLLPKLALAQQSRTAMTRDQRKLGPVTAHPKASVSKISTDVRGQPAYRGIKIFWGSATVPAGLNWDGLL